MKCNIGKIDRTLRFFAGVVLVVWAIMSENVLGYAGVILIVTAGVGLCPVYSLFGINTGCKINQE